VHLPGNIRLSRTLRRLRSRVRPGVAILGYHRVCNGMPDPLGLSVSPANFEAHLSAIARLGQPMRLAEAAASIADGRVPRRAVVLTFDDGYADNLHTVLPLLERRGIPATMFVTSGNRGGEFWWDRLARAQRGHDGLGTDLGALAAELETLAESEQEARLREVERGAKSIPGPSYRTLTAPELQALAASPLVEIGAHSVSHRPLPTLSAAQQRDEIQLSREQLEALIGRPVTCFAYPHGALSAETIAIVKAAVYTTACCSKFDVAAAGAPLLALPRLWVGNHDGPRFERWLRGWLHGR
jgi:peptidoglycan/xylan/chitin deacetylase (PgdA/CDA1 family)